MTEQAKKESIRGWYERTTRRARRAIFMATGISLVVMGYMWATSSLAMLQRLQTFNGALSVPLIGGVWIFSFIFMFLIPSREASFRAQETLEDGVETIQSLISQKIEPVVALWKRIGEKLEVELENGIVDDLKGTLKDVRDLASKMSDGNGEFKDFAKDAKPVVKALRELHERLEKEDLITELSETARVIRQLGQPLPPMKRANGKPSEGPEAEPEDKPNLGKALSMIRKKVT